jgi:hypothetical protein
VIFNTKNHPMPKTIFLSLLLISCLSLSSFSQCLTSLPPPACNGTEPLVTDGETLNGGTTKWYYGATAMINSLTLDGGTLVVCGDLTVDKFYMDRGTIFIRPGGRFVIGSGVGAGLQFKGDCSIYNYGTCEVQRNLSLENNATAATPNKVINASSSSVFKCPINTLSLTMLIHGLSIMVRQSSGVLLQMRRLQQTLSVWATEATRKWPY